MKIYRHIAFAATIACMLTAFVACVSTPTVQTKPDGTTVTNTVKLLQPAAGQAISAVAAIATPFAVKEDPHAAAYLALAANAFDLVAATGNYDPSAVQAALDTVSIRELRDNSTAKQIVLAALQAYEGLFSGAVSEKLDATSYGPACKQVLQAIATGIRAGLAQ